MYHQKYQYEKNPQKGLFYEVKTFEVFWNVLILSIWDYD